MPNRIVSGLALIGTIFLVSGYFNERNRLIKNNDNKAEREKLTEVTLRLIGAIILTIAALIQVYLSLKGFPITGIFGLGTSPKYKWKNLSSQK